MHQTWSFVKKIHRKNHLFKKENYNWEIIPKNQNPISRYLKVTFKGKKEESSDFFMKRIARKIIIIHRNWFISSWVEC